MKNKVFIFVIFWIAYYKVAFSNDQAGQDFYDQGVELLNVFLYEKPLASLLDDAIVKFERAENAFLSSTDSPPWKVARCYLNQSRGYNLYGKTNQAFELVDKANRFLNKYIQHKADVEYLACLGEIYYEMGMILTKDENLIEGRDYTLLAWETMKRLKRSPSDIDYYSDRGFLVEIGVELGILYHKLNEYEESEKILALAEDIAQNTLQRPELGALDTDGRIQEGLMWYLEDLQFNLVNALATKKESEEAVKRLLEIISHPPNPWLKAHAQNNLGIIYRKMGNEYYEKARFYLKEAKKFYDSQGIDSELAAVWDNMGDLFADQSDHDSALFYYQLALTDLIPTFNDRDIYANPVIDIHSVNYSVSNLLIILDAKAKVLFQKSQVSSEELERKRLADFSLETYQLIFEQIKEIQKGFFVDESKTFVMNQSFGIYEHGIEVAIAEQRIDLAFQFSEMAKASLSLANLKNREAQEFSGIPSYYLFKQDSFKQEILKSQKVLAQLESPDLRDSLLENLTQSRAAFNRFISLLEKEFPAYYHFKYERPELHISQVQEKLPAETSLISFFVGNNSVFRFHLDPQDLVGEKLSISKSDLDSVFNGFYSHFSSGKNKTSNYNNGWKLYNNLLGSIEDQLKPNLLIIPDGKLAYLPFEALLTEPIDRDIIFRKYPYLIKKKVISYAYSVTMWSEYQSASFDGSFSNKNSLLAFAPSFKPLSAYAETRGSSLQYIANALEVDQINQIWEGETFKGQEATLDNFFRKASDFRIIHISSHGYIDDKNSRLNQILFTSLPDSLDNEILYLYDLYRMNLKADLVVLGACVTNIGNMRRGEGVESMAHGFTYAGAKSVVSTLWYVNDKATRMLMTKFYSHLKNGKSKSLALHEAKKDLILNASEFADPYFWSGIVLIGNTDPIESAKWINLNAIIAVITIVICAIILFVSFKGKIMKK